MTRVKTFAFVLAGAMVMAVTAAAQPAPQEASPTQSLKVQVVLSRYQGEKKISSLPYTMTVTTNAGWTSLRMGAELPVASTVFGAMGADAPKPVQSYQYRAVGTDIDCTAAKLEGDRYRVQVKIEDSSVYPDDTTPAKTGHPAFRQFKSDQTIVLADGQSAQYTSATDKVTGEVVKVDVTLTVLK